MLPDGILDLDGRGTRRNERAEESRDAQGRVKTRVAAAGLAHPHAKVRPARTAARPRYAAPARHLPAPWQTLSSRSGAATLPAFRIPENASLRSHPVARSSTKFRAPSGEPKATNPSPPRRPPPRPRADDRQSAVAST